MKAPADILALLKLSDAQHIFTSPIANIWKVARADEPAALKVYHNLNPINEASGFEFIKACSGQGCVHIYDYANGVAVMEWLDGPLLGDLSRAGRDEEAGRLLIEAARTLHSTKATRELQLTEVQSIVRGFLEVKFMADCPSSTIAAFTRCKEIAADLLATQCENRPLHGDLHHDNVCMSRRGPLCFDAKGVLGELSYELASALANPIDLPKTTQNPNRALLLAEQWSKVCGVPRYRILQWATLKAAMLVRWTKDGHLDHSYDTSTVHFFLRLIDSECD